MYKMLLKSDEPIIPSCYMETDQPFLSYCVQRFDFYQSNFESAKKEQWHIIPLSFSLTPNSYIRCMTARQMAEGRSIVPPIIYSPVTTNTEKELATE